MPLLTFSTLYFLTVYPYFMNHKKLEHFRNLVTLAAADGKIEHIERVTLSKIAFQHGIPIDRMNVMLQHAKEYAYLIPQSQEDREEQLEDMIAFALVDGEFAKAERDLIFLVGQRLGFRDDEIQEMINNNLD